MVREKNEAQKYQIISGCENLLMLILTEIQQCCPARLAGQ